MRLLVQARPERRYCIFTLTHVICADPLTRFAALGPVTGTWPGSTLHFLETIQDPRYEGVCSFDCKNAE
jgi:hypothetical protein